MPLSNGQCTGDPSTTKGSLVQDFNCAKGGKSYTKKEKTVTKTRDGLCSQELKIVHTQINHQADISSRDLFLFAKH